MSTPVESTVPEFGTYQKPKETSGLRKIFKILGIVIISFLIIGAAGSFFYSLTAKKMPLITERHYNMYRFIISFFEMPT